MEIPIPPPVETRYYVRYTNDCLFINNEPISYGPQILDLDKLYIIKTEAQSKLVTPIVLDRTREVDELDRKIFYKTFLMEIVKGLEIGGFEDAAFILQRVPKNVKYFIGIIQKVSLARWIQLLSNDSFFIVLYQTLEFVISKRQISQLRTNYIEEIIQVQLKTSYSRILFLLDSLVLENESLRNSMTNLARQIVATEIQATKFFEIHLLGMPQKCLNDQDSENESLEDNKSQTGSIPQDRQMSFPEKFVHNTLKAIKTCQKIKIDKEILIKRILNQRFFKILKHFFQNFFETNKNQLLELLAIISQIDPIQMWKITFQEGRTTRCKTLLFLESLLTDSIINYSQMQKKVKITKKIVNQFLFKENKQTQQQNGINKKKDWEFASVIIEKFISVQTPQRKVFLNRIMKTLLSCRLIHQELQIVLMFLEHSTKDLVYLKKNTEIWKQILKRIENWLTNLKKGKLAKNAENFAPDAKEKRQNVKNKRKSLNIDESLQIICEESNTSLSLLSTAFTSDYLYLPISKTNIIYLLKIYKLLVENERKFGIDLDPYCLMYLIDVTEKRNGMIQGVRSALIDVIGRRENLIGENFGNEDSYDGISYE